METFTTLRPFVVGEVEYQARDIGYGPEAGLLEGYFTGAVDTWGQATFRPLNGVDHYLFADEILSVTYYDEEINDG